MQAALHLKIKPLNVLCAQLLLLQFRMLENLICNYNLEIKTLSICR